MNRLRPLCTLLPRIMSRQYATPLSHLPLTKYNITVQGPHAEDKSDSAHREALLAQLRDIPKDAPNLSITEDTPSDTEWDILSAHFTAVRELEMSTGFNEELNDEKMPIHWPIEKIELADACGEVIRSPYILQGQIKHLILNHTNELRFEGPTSAELQHMHREAIRRGEKEPEYVEADDGKKIKVTYLSNLAVEWLANKYHGKEAGDATPAPKPEPENRPVEGQESQLRTLEIIENDALDTFVRMYAALPHVVGGITSLTLRSTEIPSDLSWIGDETFLQILSALEALQTLNLFVGEIFKDPATLPSLCKNLPPNLTTLQFRGPLSFGRSDEFNEWVEAFKSESFLPKLERLAIVLDYHYRKGDNAWVSNLDTPPEEELAEARAVCERLYEAARQRGIKVQPLHDRWVNGHMQLRDVDSRW